MADRGADAVASGGIQSLNRAFSILEVVSAAPNGIGLKELAGALGLHSSTAFHLVKTMVSLGYAEQDTGTKRYRLGNGILKLVGGANNVVNLLNITQPLVEELADRTGENAHYAVRAGNDVQVVVRTEGTGAFRLTDRLGPIRPAHATAIGKVLLAFQPKTQLDRYFETAPLKPYTATTLTDAKALRAELERVQADGVAFDDMEFHAELRCAAVPVRDFRGQVMGAVGISAPTWRLTLSVLRQHVETVREFGVRISAALGDHNAGNRASCTCPCADSRFSNSFSAAKRSATSP